MRKTRSKTCNLVKMSQSEESFDSVSNFPQSNEPGAPPSVTKYRPTVIRFPPPEVLHTDHSLTSSSLGQMQSLVASKLAAVGNNNNSNGPGQNFKTSPSNSSSNSNKNSSRNSQKNSDNSDGSVFKKKKTR